METLEIKRKADSSGPARFPLREGFIVTINDTPSKETIIALRRENGDNLGDIVIERAVLRIIPTGERLGDSYTYVLPFGR